MFQYPTVAAQRLVEALGASSALLPQLDRFLEVLFFASLLREEGRAVTFNVVYPGVLDASHPTPRRGAGYGSWRVVDFRQPSEFDPTSAAKFACLAEGDGEYLIVHSVSDRLVISGVGDAQSFPLFGAERKILTARVVAPGFVRFFSGDREVLTYASGVASQPHPWPFAARNSHHGVLEDVAVAMSNLIEISPGRDVASSALRDLCAELIRRGHGGIVAIGNNDDAGLEQTEARRLEPPLAFGCLAATHWEASAIAGAHEHPSEEERVAEERASRDFDHALSLIGRMSMIDGAVLVTAELSVVGFGAKLASRRATPKVKRMSPAGSLEDFDMSKRGTRHRGAACFVAGTDRRIALIASADGDAAAMFRSSEGYVLYWPVRDCYSIFERIR